MLHLIRFSFNIRNFSSNAFDKTEEKRKKNFPLNFFWHKIWKTRRAHFWAEKKRERAIIVHVSSPFMSSYYEILEPQIWVLHYIYFFFGAYLKFLITSNKWRKKTNLFRMIWRKREQKIVLMCCSSFSVCIWMTTTKNSSDDEMNEDTFAAGQREIEGATININRVSVLHWLLDIHKMYASWMFGLCPYTIIWESYILLVSIEKKAKRRRRKKPPNVTCSRAAHRAHSLLEEHDQAPGTQNTFGLYNA